MQEIKVSQEFGWCHVQCTMCSLIRSEGRSLLNCDDSDVATHLQLHTECTHSGADNARMLFANTYIY